MTALLNNGFEYRERLGPGAEGRTLLAYLSERYQHSSPAEWTEHISAGRVLIDGFAAEHESVLRRGSQLVWKRPPWVEPDAPRSFAVLYEDDDLLAVAKPPGLPTLPGGNFLEGTLLNLVRRYAPSASPLHRLGRWTSGVVLCAKTPAARSGLTRQWSAKEIGKRYRGLGSGNPAWDRLTITTPIGPVPHPLLGSVHAAAPGGRAARSEATVLERRSGSFLCDVRIETGRPHQIRIHLASAGHPLVGDPLYLPGGLPAPDSAAVPGDGGYLLHAAELAFRHPRTGQPMTILCEPSEPLLTKSSLYRRG